MTEENYASEVIPFPKSSWERSVNARKAAADESPVLPTHTVGMACDHVRSVAMDGAALVAAAKALCDPRLYDGRSYRRWSELSEPQRSVVLSHAADVVESYAGALDG